jgi:antitoxin component of MazEF toxin-antitoxin module
MTIDRRNVSASQLVRNSRDVFELAKDSEVVITLHGKPTFILKPYAKYSNEELIDSLLGCLPEDASFEDGKATRLKTK